ncbi:MAG: flavin reductase [Dehalobacterium sp.]
MAAEDLNKSPFQLIGKEWMLVTAEKDGKANTMTASWGGLGVMWAKNVAFVVIRPQRYTKEFIDHADTFSLTFYNESMRKTLSYLGTVSGRDEDKIAKSRLTLAHWEETPYFTEAKLVMICQKLFTQEYREESFIDQGLMAKNYPGKDLHTLYIAEIKKILVVEPDA